MSRKNKVLGAFFLAVLVVLQMYETASAADNVKHIEEEPLANPPTGKLVVKRIYADEFDSSPTEVVEIKADFDRSLKDMVQAGQYVYSNPTIKEEQFPADVEKEAVGKKAILFSLFCPIDETDSEKVVKEMAKRGYRPATFRELLIFGEHFPHLQEQFQIIALGTNIKSEYATGGWTMLGIFPGGMNGGANISKGREVEILYSSGRWLNQDHFLAVKISKK